MEHEVSPFIERTSVMIQKAFLKKIKNIPENLEVNQTSAVWIYFVKRRITLSLKLFEHFTKKCKIVASELLKQQLFSFWKQPL